MRPSSSTPVRIIEFLQVISFMHFSLWPANATDSCNGPLAKKETAIEKEKTRGRESEKERVNLNQIFTERALKWNQFLLCDAWKVSNDFQLLPLLQFVCPSVCLSVRLGKYWQSPQGSYYTVCIDLSPYELHNPISVLNDVPCIVQPSDNFLLQLKLLCARVCGCGCVWALYS